LLKKQIVASWLLFESDCGVLSSCLTRLKLNRAVQRVPYWEDATSADKQTAEDNRQKKPFVIADCDIFSRHQRGFPLFCFFVLDGASEKVASGFIGAVSVY